MPPQRRSAVSFGSSTDRPAGSSLDDDSLMHVSDWVPTVISMCSVPPSAEPPGYKIDGLDQWSSIVSGTAGPRKEGKRHQSSLNRGLLYR